MNFEYKAAFNDVLGIVLSVIRYEFAIKKRSQSEFSEDIGFNRRLLSKYELGTSNISYATFIYLMECNQIDDASFKKIMKHILKLLARKGIYVYLRLDNVALNNLEEETLQKSYVKDSYKHIYDWFGLRYEIHIPAYDEFQNLSVLNYKEIDDAVQSVMKFGRLKTISSKERNELKNQRINFLSEEIHLLELDILKAVRSSQNEKIAQYLEEIKKLEEERERIESIDHES